MEPKQYFHLECEKSDYNFSFKMPAGCPIGAAYDAAFEFLSQLAKLANDASDRMKREKEEGKENVSQE